MNLSEKIISEIEKRKIKQSDLARLIGVDSTVVSSIIKGRRVGNLTISRLVKALGPEYEQYYEYQTCEICGKKFLPKNNRIKTCSVECSRLNVNKICAKWAKSNRSRNVAKDTDAQRFGWGAKVKGPAVSVAEYNSVARKEHGSYGQRGAAERLAQSGTMRESMGLG